MVSSERSVMYRPTTAESKSGSRCGIIIRPSSASAKLQREDRDDRLLASRPATAAVTLHPVREAYEPKNRPATSFADQEKPRKKERRLTLSETTGIGNNAEALIRLNTPSSTGEKIKVEERITLEQLYLIKTAFEEADTDGSGTLDIDEFKSVVKKSLGIQGRNEEQIIALFMKIDSSSDGEIDWDEFCTYMQLEYSEKEEALLRSKKVIFHLPPIVSSSHFHKATGTVLRILQIGESTFMCCTKEGILSTWSGDLKLRKSKSIICESGNSSFSIKPTMWVTDVAVLPIHNKVVVGTGDRDIYFYDLSTLELCCRLTGFDSIPLCMDVCEIEQDFIMISYGDDQGCVGIIEMKKVSETFRLWKKAPMTNNMPTLLIQDVSCEEHIYFVKWKVHNDWISRLEYYHDLHSVVSSCNQTAYALVRGCIRPSTNIDPHNVRGASAVSSHRRLSRQGHRRRGRQMPEGRRRQAADQSVFSVYKGVSTFEYCKERNTIATGGMDRIVRLWNPYMPHKPTGYLRGHNSPLVFVSLSGVNDRVFSISADKVVKVWDLVEQTCLVTLSPKLHKITGEILTCTYSESLKALAVVTDHITLLKISQKVNLRAEMPTSHTEAVTCIGYNPSFNHVITCSESGIVKLWDFDNGSSMFEFNKAHGDEAITCMSFDASGRRLVTGGRDGAIRIWNYNNGHCLRTLIPEGNPAEVASCLYLETNRNRFIAGVGWDKKINMYPDDVQDFRSIQRPENKWKNYDKVGHKEDIVTAAHGPPNLLATASYDGLINVWNYVSGNLMMPLPFPSSITSERASPSLEDDDSGYGNDRPDAAVTKLIFIKKRIPDRDSAALIAGCADGSLLFWGTHDKTVYSCCVVTHRPCAIRAMALLDDENTLYIGDDLGFVRVWNIEDYALHPSADVYSKPPPLLIGWRCHIKQITDICIVEKHGVLITSSIDCTVRIWKLSSEYIGTFGQSGSWDIYDESTWSHPMVPQEVLLDPMSMPEHPIFQEKSSLYEIIHQESIEPSDSEDEEQSTDNDKASSNGDKQNLKVTASPRRPSRAKDADEIWRHRLSRRLSRAVILAPDDFRRNEDDSMLNDIQSSMSKSAGKRLRHERLLSYQRRMNLHVDAGSHAFQSLKCFDLQQPDLTDARAIEAKTRNESPILPGIFTSIKEQVEE